MITGAQIGWIAGFLEGEGHFRMLNGTPGVRAKQVERGPLERLSSLVGGNVIDKPAPTERNQPYSNWGVYGRRAIEVMMTIYPMMSAKRRHRIGEVISIWRAVPGKGWHRKLTHCKYGHPFTARYWRTSGKGQQICMECRELYAQKRRSERPVARTLGG